jgi:hypothetical protein
MSHQYTTQRSGEITGSENAESLELPKPIRDFGREKKLPDGVRKENEDDEVIELQETSQSGQTECLIIPGGKVSTRKSGDGFHVFDPFNSEQWTPDNL